MIVKDIKYLDESRNECFLTLTSQDAELICFSDMKEFFCGEEINTTLEANFVNNIRICKDEEELIFKIGDHNYQIIGRLFNKNEGLIAVKSFLIHVAPYIIPNDLKDGDFIYFEVERFDLY